MELNILNEKLNVDVSKVHELSEYDFWYLYCQMLNLRKNTLTDKDCIVLARILEMPILENSILEKSNGYYLEDITKTSLSNLFAKAKQLVDKGFLVKTDNGYFLHPSFVSFQKYVKQQDKPILKFTIPVTIKS